MCGICGFGQFGHNATSFEIAEMCRYMRHRGPDDMGVTKVSHPSVDSPAEVCFGHVRLSIIDLSSCGHQPMCNEDGTVWITYNGECYNFKELRSELVNSGHHFKSESDTEVLIHLYEEYGVERMLRKINGMFAFSIWDDVKQELVLARDRMGQKPLYYMLNSGQLYFASELKAFAALDVFDRKVDLEGVDQTVSFGYTWGGRTVFQQIKQLPQGHYAVWKNKIFEVRKYYSFEFSEESRKSERELIDELEELLIESVRVRMVADVPVGLFLSGGVDSSLIAAITKKALGIDLRAYTIAFGSKEYDESLYARRIADHLGLELLVETFDEKNTKQYEDVCAHIFQPFGDASLLPTALVSECASKHVKVVLTGDGADELFGGYDAYRQALRYWGDDRYRHVFRSNESLYGKLWDLKHWIKGFPDGYLYLQSQFSDRLKKKLYSDKMRNFNVSRANFDEKKMFISSTKLDVLKSMQYSDIQTIFVEDMLLKVDRMSMMHGLEARSPFLDPKILEFSSRLPDNMKIRKGERSKRILRLLLERYLPSELFDRPKQGFCCPWERVCRESYARELQNRWAKLDVDLFRKDAGRWLFPCNKDGNMFRTWSGFSLLRFFENLEAGFK